MKNLIYKVTLTFIALILIWLSTGCTYNIKKSEGLSEEESSQSSSPLVDSLANGIVITMNNLDISREGDFIIRMEGKPFTGRSFSLKSFNGRSVAFEDITDGNNIINFEIYYPNRQKAYECKDGLSYDGNYYSPDGKAIDFYEFAEKYYEVWCRHEGYLPVNLLCPACILNQLEYEKNPKVFNEEESARYKLLKKYGSLDNL